MCPAASVACEQEGKLATRVVKVGGSLLRGTSCTGQLMRWFDQPNTPPTLIVVGGGELADGVRALDQRFHWSARTAHRQAIQAMRVNSLLLSHLDGSWLWLPQLDRWSDVTAVARSLGPVHAVLDPLFLLDQPDDPRTRDRLPCSWQVTSDSIAAHVAAIVGAEELVLLKSTLSLNAASSLSLQAAAACQLVDQYFPSAVPASARIRLVNLRDPRFPEMTLHP